MLCFFRIKFLMFLIAAVSSLDRGRKATWAAVKGSYENCLLERDHLFVRRAGFLRTVDGFLDLGRQGIWKVTDDEKSQYVIQSFKANMEIVNRCKDLATSKSQLRQPDENTIMGWAANAGSDSVISSHLFSVYLTHLLRSYPTPSYQINLQKMASRSVQTRLWIDKFHGKKKDFDDVVEFLNNQTIELCLKQKDVRLSVLVDSSWSIGKDHFNNYVKPFVGELAGYFAPSNRFCMVVYASKAELAWSFNRAGNKNDVEPSMRYHNKGTNTELGLKKVYDECISKVPDSTPQVLLTLTDGVPSECRETDLHGMVSYKCPRPPFSL